MAPNKIGGPPSFAEAPSGGEEKEGSPIITADEVKARGCGTKDPEDVFIWPRDEPRVWFTGMMVASWLAISLNPIIAQASCSSRASPAPTGVTITPHTSCVAWPTSPSLAPWLVAGRPCFSSRQPRCGTNTSPSSFPPLRQSGSQVCHVYW